MHYYHDVSCAVTLFGWKRYEEAMSDDHPMKSKKTKIHYKNQEI